MASLRGKPAKASLLGEGQGEGLCLISIPRLQILAALDRPALNGVVEEAARKAGLQIVLLKLNQLRAAAHLCVTRSEKSMKQYGIPSVAEAVALAAAGAGARLLIPRFCGRNATASVAILR
jgi:cobalt-precorrin 5A hydrolase